MNLNAARWTAVPGVTFEFDDRTAGGDWIGVRGGGLSRSVAAKFALINGTTRLTGLRFDDGLPVTARSLREPRVAAIEAAFVQYRLQDQRRRGEVAQQVASHLDREDLTDIEREDLSGTARVLDQAQDQDQAWLARLAELGEGVDLRPRGRGAAPPTDQELAAFARELLQQRLAGRGAVTRTAAAVGMNRSTVYRWTELCTERGLLVKGTNHG